VEVAETRNQVRRVDLDTNGYKHEMQEFLDQLAAR
jgi:hypothetical protein